MIQTRPRRLPKRRLPTRSTVILVAAITFAGVTSTASAAPPADVAPAADRVDAAPAPFEVEALAARHGVSQGAARAQILAERRLPLLTERAQKVLADRFGGLRVDPDAKGRIKLSIVATDGDIAEADATRAAQAVADAGLVGKVDLVPAQRSERDIVSLQASLDGELASANEGAPVTIDVEPDIASGTVRVNVPPNPTDLQRKFVDSARKRFAGKLSEVKKAGRATLQACNSGAFCDPPLRGGIRLIYGGQGICSSGFVMRSLSDNVRYLSTAGHCVNGRFGTWTTHFSNGSSHDIGAPHNLLNDFGILRINNPGGWSPGPYVETQSDQTYPITSYGSSGVGAHTCLSGGFTASNCGQITGGLATREGIPNTYRANYCSQGGDSGGSVFGGNRARGSHLGAYSGCDTFFFSAAAFSGLNVVPLLQ